MTEHEKPITLIEEPFREQFARVARGLRAPRGSGERRYAWFVVSRVFAPPLTSFGMGLAIVIVLVTMVTSKGLQENREVEVTVMDIKTVDLDKIKEEIQQIDEPLDVPVETVALPSEMPSVETTPGPSPVAETTVANIAPVLTKSPLIIRGLYGNRMSAGSRAQALRAYGGSGVGEDAVLRALRWLKANQGEDGSWAKADKTHPAAMAGLALLTFLAHGETPASPEFGATVEKAIKYLISVQRENGMFSDGGNAYGHGIDTYAISEAYALTRIMALKDSMEKAIQVIIDGQQGPGGYNYGFTKGDRFDMSVSGWQFQALKAAKMAGTTNPRIDEAITKSIDFLKHNAFAPAGDNAGFVYSGKPGEQPTGGASWTMTGAGTLCLQLLGQGKSAEARAGVSFLDVENRVPKAWPKGAGGNEKDAPKVPVYGWYYVCQAKFQHGGSTWENWNRFFAKELITNQARDGHWDGGDHGGAVYTTTLSALMLQVYYRYLPTYRKVEDTTEVAVQSADEDAVVVQ
jgi:hypothetical protein